MDSKWPNAIVAVAFLALIGIVLVITLPRAGQDADTFLKVWSGVGVIVGVAVGAIPSFFFKQKAEQAIDRKDNAESTAQEALVALARHDGPTADSIRARLK